MSAGLDDQRRFLEEAQTPLKFRPAFAGGLCVREIYGGAGNGTKACQQAGIPALGPVELFEDPVRCKGRRPDHDVRDPEVKSRLLADAGESPGPRAANVWQLAPRCDSFSDWNLLNKETRAFANPEGDGTKPNEANGN